MRRTWNFLGFSAAGGFKAIAPAAVPAVFLDAYEGSGDPKDMDQRLDAAHCACIESYGSDMGLDVWEHADGWLVHYFTDSKLLIQIVVTNIIDFLALQAAFINPTAMKIMAEFDHFEKMKAIREASSPVLH